MDDPMLRADCQRCAALCCLALAFDRSAWFAFDKAAGEACPNLRSDCRCGIHSELVQRGFEGCARYDCWGAGQRVTLELFAARSWQTEPKLAMAMIDAFRVLREVHELIWLLKATRRLPLTPSQERTRDALLVTLQPAVGWSTQALALFERGPVPTDARAFLRSLRKSVRSERVLRRRLRVLA